jgi:uncharacterized membrane-anchored protein YhcB (DUF1043 family)
MEQEKIDKLVNSTKEMQQSYEELITHLSALIGFAYREGRLEERCFDQDTIQQEFMETETYKLLTESENTSNDDLIKELNTKELPITGLVREQEVDEQLYERALLLKQEDKVFAHASRHISSKSDLVWFYRNYINKNI